MYRQYLLAFKCLVKSKKCICFVSYQFRCKNHQCILKSHRCNGFYECDDKSDEEGCDRVASCSNGKFIRKNSADSGISVGIFFSEQLVEREKNENFYSGNKSI